VNQQGQSDAPVSGERYEQFRDASGSWTFESGEYQEDLDSIAPVDVSHRRESQDAYRATVFLEGLIQERKSTASWSADALEQFESLESTGEVEVEAVTKALRGVASRTGQ